MTTVIISAIVSIVVCILFFLIEGYINKKSLKQNFMNVTEVLLEQQVETVKECVDLELKNHLLK